MSGTRFLVARDLTRRDRTVSASEPAQQARSRPVTAIRQLMFDLGGILYDDSAWRRWLLHLVGHMGLNTHYTSFYRVWDCEFQADVWSGKFRFWPALKRFLVTAGLSQGQADEVEAACRARFREFDQDIRPFPAVAETLDRITASGCAVTVSSHAPLSAPEIAARLAELGLSRSITHVSCSGVDMNEGIDGFRRFAQQRCRVPKEGGYVGRDSGQLAAARQAGLQTVAFNHDADAQANYYIEQFDQLLQVLDLDGRWMLAAG